MYGTKLSNEIDLIYHLSIGNKQRRKQKI